MLGPETEEFFQAAACEEQIYKVDYGNSCERSDTSFLPLSPDKTMVTYICECISLFFDYHKDQ